MIPVTTECTRKNGVSEEVANFVVPLCSNVHMCGSVIKLATTAVAVALMMGQPISFGLFLNFMLILAVATVASPGVMSGVLMASVGFLESMLGFTPEMTAVFAPMEHARRVTVPSPWAWNVFSENNYGLPDVTGRMDIPK